MQSTAYEVARFSRADSLENAGWPEEDRRQKTIVCPTGLANFHQGG
ncbi:hypothetical protein SBA3_1650034 [Candidatus Sulfopaludibacter sp. SbA3]|nr:hypothetical protein SBA3_1650034 [Candidatus Sulfopaludibacter sp. SbA3]